MGSAPQYSRRGVLGRAAALGLLAAPGALLSAGCAVGGGLSGDRAVGVPATRNNPLGVDPDASLEVVVFDGGFGDGYARDAEQLYRGSHPGAVVRHTATQDIQPQLQPRFVGGDPPDLIDNSGAKQLDAAALAAAGQLIDLTALLDAPSVDAPATPVRQSLLPGTADRGRFGGREVYALNCAYTVFGLYYSRSLLARHGWEYPATWDDMVRLCAAAKRRGLAGWTYPGSHPNYLTFTFYPFIATLGGAGVLTAMDNLEPGAFRHEAVRAAVAAYHELAAKGYVLQGSSGLDHIRAQTAWTEGKAVFIPNGSWVENEARPTTPPGFRMAVGPNPAPHRTPAAVWAEAGEPYVVPANARNPAGGMELLRIMLGRRSARNFVRLAGSLSCVRGATDGLALPPGLASASALLELAGPHTVVPMLPVWYPTLHRRGIGGALGELMAGRIAPEECLARFQRAADEAAKDSSLRHPRHER
jgi:N-acetylglucosamine transport system substrate-binding protein